MDIDENIIKGDDEAITDVSYIISVISYQFCLYVLYLYDFYLYL